MGMGMGPLINALIAQLTEELIVGSISDCFDVQNPSSVYNVLIQKC